ASCRRRWVSRACFRSTSGARIERSGHQALVADPVRLVGRRAELLVAERLVVADVALEEADLAVALEREDVGGDPVEEPAIVADDDDAARERFEAGLERP